MTTESTTQQGQHFAGSEELLLQQIKDLEKQLADRLEDDPKWIRDTRFKERMYNIIAAVFMPTDAYNKFQKTWYKESTHWMWWKFRAALLEHEVCRDFFASPAFREVLNDMNNFIDDTHRIETRQDPYDLLRSSADVLLDNTTSEGWSLMIDALKAIEPFNRTEDDYIFSPGELQDLKISLQTIHRCVKMYHEATEPENEKD